MAISAQIGYVVPLISILQSKKVKLIAAKNEISIMYCKFHNYDFHHIML